MISKREFSLPRLDIAGMWVFSLGVWFHIVPVLFTAALDGFFLAELIAAILALSAHTRCWMHGLPRVSREEREALEARQQAMMEGQQEGGHVSH